MSNTEIDFNLRRKPQLSTEELEHYIAFSKEIIGGELSPRLKAECYQFQDGLHFM